MTVFYFFSGLIYPSGVQKIPTACITVEDAEMMTRMAARGTKIVINLKMAAKTLPPVVSRNTVAEIKGSVYPEQVSAFLFKSSKLMLYFVSSENSYKDFEVERAEKLDGFVNPLLPKSDL